ncbi:MAG TPA: hypothetical protein VEY12_10790 [Thermoplasmata archaeon]|nr:hypothetical protein [Thermoplasmata archaeon]
MRDLAAVVREAARILSSLRIRYVIVGGVGANLYGRPRSTFDVDLILEVREGDAERLARAFRGSGFSVSPEDIVDALRERSHFTVHDRESEYRLDCKGSYTARERVALELRRRVRSGRRFLYVDAPEDLIVAKLLFGSPQDLLDAEAVYVRQRPRLDLRHVSSLAGRFGVAEEWKALRRRVDRILKERA